MISLNLKLVYLLPSKHLYWISIVMCTKSNIWPPFTCLSPVLNPFQIPGTLAFLDSARHILAPRPLCSYVPNCLYVLLPHLLLSLKNHHLSEVFLPSCFKIRTPSIFSITVCFIFLCGTYYHLTLYIFKFIYSSSLLKSAVEPLQWIFHLLLCFSYRISVYFLFLKQLLIGGLYLMRHHSHGFLWFFV